MNFNESKTKKRRVGSISLISAGLLMGGGVVLTTPFLSSYFFDSFFASNTPVVLNSAEQVHLPTLGSKTQSSIVPFVRPKIQLAILLDTSNSMDGLIDQTRNQIWQVINEFSNVAKNGVQPVLEVALFEYGNDNNPKSLGYVRQISGFTRELDRISEGLFSLTTSGGSEYCGMAIKTAVNTLQWSHSAQDIKTIFIAGNEPFSQGPVKYQQALTLANKYGITVNTIFAGDHQSGISIGWQSGALAAGGEYMSINADIPIEHIETPHDKQIAVLNDQLNDTYIPFGQEGIAGLRRQNVEDKKSRNISAGLLASRAKSKASTFYDNAQWDLVDAVSNGQVAEHDLAEMEDAGLPEPMREMTATARQEYVAKKAAERKEIKQKIVEFSTKREAYLAQQKSNAVQSSQPATMSDALVKAIKKQVAEKNFELTQEVQQKPLQKIDSQVNEKTQVTKSPNAQQASQQIEMSQPTLMVKSEAKSSR
ncbi:vWA domain-containing protein [Aliikangiella maris]|uniref:VWA domain-containing protein n=2 Tax=Aliikangiella maris TaxID=3162458 RepID=A0ABV2BPV3_9GAMM